MRQYFKSDKKKREESKRKKKEEKRLKRLNRGHEDSPELPIGPADLSEASSENVESPPPTP